MRIAFGFKKTHIRPSHLMPNTRINIVIGYLLLLAVLAAAALMLYFSASRLSSNISNLSETLILKNQLIHDFRNDMFQLQLSTDNLVENQNPAERKNLESLITKLNQDNRNRLQILQTLASDSSEQQLIQSMITKRENLATHRQSVIYLSKSTPQQAMHYFHQKELPVFNQFLASTDSLSTYHLNQSKEKGKNLTKQLSIAQYILNLLLFATFIIMLAIGRMVYQSNQRLQTQNKELHQSEVRFRQLLQGVPYAIIGTNPQGQIQYANHRALSLFGYTQKELIGSPAINLIPKKTNQHPNENEHEYTGIKKDQTPFACEIAFTTIETREGLLTLHSIKDITKRKAAQHQIIQLSQAVEQSSATIIITDTEGNIQYVNKKFTQTSGYTPQEVIGKNPRILKSGHTTTQEYGTLWNNISAGKEWKGELHNKKKNGELYWERALISPIVDNNGTITNFLAVKEDITQLKQSENQIHQSEQKLREAQRIAKVGSWELNLETNRITFSDELLTLFEITQQDHTLTLERLFDFIHPNDKERVLTNIYTVNGTKKTGPNRFRIITRTGQLKHLEARGSNTPNHTGEITTLTGTMQDITELVKLENEKAQIHRQTMLTLETKVSERTHEINIQKNIIEQKNKDLTDSIVYAQRLQKALYPNIEILKRQHKHSFILNKPCTIVSGDFCWFHQKQNKLIIACVDCTGHGVPGAFMSIIGIEILNHIVIDKGILNPTEILELMDSELEKVLPQKKQEIVKDGMDISLCVIDRENKKIQFAGANHPAVIVSAKTANLHKANRYGLGKYIISVRKHFVTQQIAYKQGDMLYLFTDGFRDQFGGPRNKKIGLNQFITILEQVSPLAAEQQKEELIQQFTTWQGNKEQVDDVMVVGIGL